MRDIWYPTTSLIIDSEDSEISDEDNDEAILENLTILEDLFEELHDDILGLYCRQDVLEALYRETFVKFFQRAAAAAAATIDDSHANYVLGYYYYNGFGIERDYQQAFNYYQLATKQNHPGALYNICMLYGIEGEQGIQSIRTMPREQLVEFKVSMYVKSGSQGNYTNSYDELVNYYQNFEDWHIALDKLYRIQLQTVNNYNACTDASVTENKTTIAELYNQLGFICIIGWACANNYYGLLANATEFFDKAAELGNASAYFNLGYYKYGSNFSSDRNEQKEMEMYEMAASIGHPLAQYQLGYRWISTLKREVENCKKSYAYFHQSSTYAYSDTMVNLGFMYVNGMGGVEQNFQTAIDYFRAASVVDDMSCTHYSRRECFGLGFMYEHGIGVNIDLNLAGHFYAYGATFQLNNTHSLCHLAKLIEKQRIFPSSIRDAVELYKRSIASNDEYTVGYASYRLGKIYDNPRYEEYYNQEMAVRHYLFALDRFESHPERLGEEGADDYYHAATMYEKGYGVEKDLDMALTYCLLSIKAATDKSEIYEEYYGEKAKRKHDKIIQQKAMLVAVP